MPNLYSVIRIQLNLSTFFGIYPFYFQAERIVITTYSKTWCYLWIVYHISNLIGIILTNQYANDIFAKLFIISRILLEIFCLIFLTNNLIISKKMIHLLIQLNSLSKFNHLILLKRLFYLFTFFIPMFFCILMSCLIYFYLIDIQMTTFSEHIFFWNIFYNHIIFFQNIIFPSLLIFYIYLNLRSLNYKILKLSNYKFPDIGKAYINIYSKFYLRLIENIELINNSFSIQFSLTMLYSFLIITALLFSKFQQFINTKYTSVLNNCFYPMIILYGSQLLTLCLCSGFATKEVNNI